MDQLAEPTNRSAAAAGELTLAERHLIGLALDAESGLLGLGK